MTEAMPFLQKTILLSYDPRPFGVVSKCALREKKEEGPRFPGDLPSEI